MSPRRDRLLALRRKVAELRRRELRKVQAADGGLIHFVRHFWHILEPKTPFVDGWALHAICDHLEAVSRGEITRLLVNVPPGFMKSLLVNVFWPAWEWGPRGNPHLRYVAFSYGAHLTLRDNEKFRNLVTSAEYQRLWGDKFKATAVGVVKIANDKTGSKFASSVGGTGTGERGDVVIVDDPHNVVDSESELVRSSTVRWFDEALSNRVNSLEDSKIVVIMQRVHFDDVSGFITKNEPDYVHLMIPMEYDPSRHCGTRIGWEDPRIDEGELAWPERYSERGLARFKRNAYLWSGQYQQIPIPRGGGIFKEEWWEAYETADGSVPPMDYIVASLDPAYTESQENDYSALVILGVYQDAGISKIMVLDAWQKRLVLHGKDPERLPNETLRAWAKRCGPEWGLIEWVSYSCRRWKVDRLLIEGKASGLSVAQEIRRQHANEGYTVGIEQVKGDKEARAHAVTGLFTDGLITYPVKPDGLNYAWADTLLNAMSSFPRATHDDLVDAMTQGLKHLKSATSVARHEERLAAANEDARYRPQAQPLYDC